jgi:flavin-dependent dehydrogenase
MEEKDCLIIGGGPAGLTAAVYLARYRRNVVVFDTGGAALMPESHNYPGFANGISGRDLLSRLDEQANAYDVAVIKARVTSLARTDAGFMRAESFLLVLCCSPQESWMYIQRSSGSMQRSGRDRFDIARCAMASRPPIAK